MALAQVSESDEDEEYHSLSGNEPDDGEDMDDDAESAMEPPVHPVPSLQGAFEESITESTEGDDVSSSTDSDAEVRRQKLLEANSYDDAWTTRWKQKPSAQYHPLLKLMAQIVFGMHLLQQGQAKSNEEVVKILQTHVNEVDTFLERTSEDFSLAITDIEERIRHLKLPMEHLDVFNTMLDDKKFRTQLLDGNDKIEKIIERTAKAMNAALMDVRKGLQAAHELGKYLDDIKERWPRDNSGIAEVFGAMRGNEQGWMRYLKELQAKGKNLSANLIKLGTVIGEMSKLAAAASRRSAQQSSRAQSSSRSTRSMPVSPGLRSKFARDDAEPMPTIALALNKPLPKEPDTAAGAARMSAVPKLHPVPFAQRYEQPRQSPQSPPPNTRRVSTMPNGSPARPRTAGAPRDARASSSGTSDLAEFLKHSGPLRSNPPESGALSTKSAGRTETRANRSRSQGANDLMNSAVANDSPARSKSHGAAVILTSSGNMDAKSRPSSRGAESVLASNSTPASRKDSVASTGFARRISHRLKHIPPPIDSAHNGYKPDLTPIVASPAPPTDSAYSSGTDRRGEEPTRSTPRPPSNTAPPVEGSSIAQSATDMSPRPPSRLGLFPRADEPRMPSAVSMKSDFAGSRTGTGMLNNMSSVATSPASSQPSKSSRTMSIRNMFHRRQKSWQLV